MRDLDREPCRRSGITFRIVVRFISLEERRAELAGRKRNAAIHAASAKLPNFNTVAAKYFSAGGFQALNEGDVL